MLLVGTAFGTAAMVNELALADRPAIASRFGPTDPTLEVPACDAPLDVGSTAKLDLLMDSSIDDRRTGQVRIDGFRDGADFAYTGFARLAAHDGPAGHDPRPGSRLAARARAPVDERHHRRGGRTTTWTVRSSTRR